MPLFERINFVEFKWIYQESTESLVRTFLKRQGISKKLLAKIKFQGGKILVNDTEQNVLFSLKTHDIVTVVIPDEEAHETLLADDVPIEIIF